MIMFYLSQIYCKCILILSVVPASQAVVSEIQVDGTDRFSVAESANSETPSVVTDSEIIVELSSASDKPEHLTGVTESIDDIPLHASPAVNDPPILDTDSSVDSEDVAPKGAELEQGVTEPPAEISYTDVGLDKGINEPPAQAAFTDDVLTRLPR